MWGFGATVGLPSPLTKSALEDTKCVSPRTRVCCEGLELDLRVDSTGLDRRAA
jgi:hypothetical protein